MDVRSGIAEYRTRINEVYMPPLICPPVVFFDLGDTLVFFDSTNQRRRYADALDTLQVLQERGYRLGLISNQAAGTTIPQVLNILSGLGLDRYIEPALITISTEILNNLGKPAQPIFDLALQKAGHPAASERAIFVTETLAHIQAARGFGWRAILKRNAGSCQPAEGECAASLAGLLDMLPDLADTAGTNLDLAPRPRLVDGLWAVPVDIQRVDASLTFDGLTSTATADATVEFRMGRQAGSPIFDLRQTITSAELDGASIPVAQLAHHDFGGGANANLRVIEPVLDAGTSHTLRLVYTLGPPQASTAGSYQPSLTWSSGPRLAFNFGFTDLGAGRYLEAWLPANLIYDQFELALELRLTNTSVAHTLITNGTFTTPGTNHWQVNFPARFTALSPLLEIRAADSLTGTVDTTTLPVSGANVTIEAWKLASSAVNLTNQINLVKTHLADNENSTGTYMHGSRFVAFLHLGGMEYEGGTTTSTGALRHEVFHSWWARGVKPASQPDAWYDEGWTVYNDNGAGLSQPFNFSDPPVTLCPRNEWVRITASGAYGNGNRFWEGVAAFIGVSTLRSLMAEFYQQRRRRPATTAQIEAFLLCRTGNAQLVDAFHRFVYGFSNPTTQPDLWLRDDPGHTGADLWPGAFWDSPDLWVRNAEDGSTAHQPPEFGQDNWFYARVHNRGASTARHFMVTFHVKQFAGTQFVYPNDFLPCTAASPGFELAPGASVIVKARWPRSLVPPTGSHACLLAAVLTRSDHPASGSHVWEHNNLAQKNLTIVDLAPNEWFVLPFVISNLMASTARRFFLELVRPKRYPDLEASLLHRSKIVFKGAPDLTLKPFTLRLPVRHDGDETLLDCSGAHAPEVGDASPSLNAAITSARPELLARQFDQGVEVFFAKGPVGRIPVTIQPKDQLLFGLRLKVPKQARKGETLRFDLVQRDLRSKRVVGGVAVEIRVV
jgi:phosphoglycolate phosphatase-like HAD superfamily hydrolase